MHTQIFHTHYSISIVTSYWILAGLKRSRLFFIKKNVHCGWMVNQFSDAEAEIRELPNVVSDEAYPMQRDLPMFLTSEANYYFYSL